jgi:hypothetical protein
VKTAVNVESGLRSRACYMELGSPGGVQLGWGWRQLVFEHYRRCSWQGAVVAKRSIVKLRSFPLDD